MLCTANPRTQLYRLLAQSLFDETDFQLACNLRELPGMIEYVPRGPELDEWLADMSAEHHRLFGQNISPYESIFRGNELMFNTTATQHVVAFYQSCGFTPTTRRAVAPDHIGIELALAATLSARADQSSQAAEQFARLLHEHIGTWLPACAAAIGRIARAPLYRLLADIATELVLYDLAEFTPSASSPAQAQARTDRFTILSWNRHKGNEGAVLRQILQRFLTPHQVGIMLCRADLTRIGHSLGLRVPVASREQMLMVLVGAAGRFGMISQFLEALEKVLHDTDQYYAELMHAHPAWEPHGQAWRKRISVGLGLLDELAETYQALRVRAHDARNEASVSRLV